MGGPVDTFVVRLVLAMTVVAWGSVLVHDLLDADDTSAPLTPASVGDDTGPLGAPLDPPRVPTANTTGPPARPST